MPNLEELIQETKSKIGECKKSARLFAGKWAYKSAYQTALQEIAHAEMRLTVLRALQDGLACIDKP